VTVEAQLLARLQEHAVQIAAAAADEFVADVRRSTPPAPRDTGRLVRGIRRGQVRRTGMAVEVDVESLALSDGGFDYPEYIDKVARVVPTRRKFLRWEGAGGRPVFSRGYTNRHRGFWGRLVTEKRWVDALARTAGR
jgi:hypothetical protein